MKPSLKLSNNKIFKSVVNVVKKIPLPLVLLLSMLPLRLINLGYSEYICDESVALSWLKVNKAFYSLDFLFSQHKGPLQYLIGGLIFLFTKDVFNELIFRLPFAFANCVSVAVFYLFVKNITKSKPTAFISAFLFGVNGFVLVFGRIFQYQSFNLLFSLLSMYFYSKIPDDAVKNDAELEKKVLKYSLFGTMFFCFSILAHWDAIFVLPYLALVIFKNILLKKNYSNIFKKKFIFLNLSIIVLLAVSFLIPYILNYRNSIENQAYFKNRVNPSKMSVNKFISRAQFILFRIRLYNPILFLEFNFFMLFLSLLFIKKTWFYLLWLLAEIYIFIVIFSNPGTHIYNLFIPLLISTSMVFNQIFRIVGGLKKYPKIILTLVILLLLTHSMIFLYFQSYTLFVDHNPEYPWRKKMIANFEVGNFTDQERAKYLTNNKIGFPLRREWEKIEGVLSKYEETNGFKIGSTKIQTNENVCPVNFYTGREVSSSGTRFIVSIKYPLSFVTDYKRFSGKDDKDIISEIKNSLGGTTAKIYITN